MTMKIISGIIVGLSKAVMLAISLVAIPAFSQSPNPNYFYYYDGNAIARGWSVGDPGNWTVPLENGTAKSANGKISAQLDNFKREGDAIRAVWSKKKERGQLSLFGNPINIKEYENRAALTFEIKVNKKPSKPVELSMDCGWPCRGSVHIRETLQKAKTGEWFLMPVPLNCFSIGAENFDLTKINGIFVLATEGKLDVSVANIRLELLPENEKGCATE